MAKRDPFRLVFGLGIAMKIIHIAAYLLYVVSLMAIRFEDQVNDPWHSWDWWFFALSCTLILPLFLADMLRTSYDVAVLFSIQTGLAVIWTAWGFLHSVLLTIAFNNCNEQDSSVFKYPYCVNRNYPAQTWPDFSMYIYWITILVMTACNAFWVWYGYRLRMASYALEWASAAAGGYTGAEMKAKTGKDVSTAPALQAYHDHISGVMAEALSKNSFRTQDHIGIEMHQSAAVVNELAGAHVYNALVKFNSSKGNTGVGLPTFAKFMNDHHPEYMEALGSPPTSGRPLGDTIQSKLAVMSTHVPHSMGLNGRQSVRHV